MKIRWLVPLGLILASCGTAAALTTGNGGDDSTTTAETHKVFVCKYVGTPGEDERLQTGDNPISVDVDSLKNFSGIGSFFNDKQGRSIAIAFDTGQPEPSVDECPAPTGGTTTTTAAQTTTTKKPYATTTTTEKETTTTAPPRGSLLGVDDFAFCGEDNLPEISITFGNRPDLDGDIGILDFSDGTSFGPLTFQSGATRTLAYPASRATPLTLTYRLMGETATAVVTLPEDCPPATTTTTTAPGSTSTTTTTTTPGATTTTQPNSTTTTVPGATTTLPETFTFGAAATVCVSEVPTIRIIFQNQFPSLAGRTGTLAMADVSGNVVSTTAVVYQPGATVDLLYPGTRVNSDGSIADVPGWNLNSSGFWVRDPSDEFLRAGINLTYTVNPTATAFVTYPPESSTCANPSGPFPPAPPAPGGPTPPVPPKGLPPTL